MSGPAERNDGGSGLAGRECEECCALTFEVRALRTRVASLEAVVRAAREVCDEADEPEAAIVRLDAALAAVEVKPCAI